MNTLEKTIKLLQEKGIIYILSETNGQLRLCYMNLIEHYDQNGEPLCEK